MEGVTVSADTNPFHQTIARKASHVPGALGTKDLSTVATVVASTKQSESCFAGHATTASTVWDPFW